MCSGWWQWWLSWSLYYCSMCWPRTTVILYWGLSIQCIHTCTQFVYISFLRTPVLWTMTPEMTQEHVNSLIQQVYIVWLSTGYAIELCIVMHGVLSIERILLYSCQIEMCFLQIVCVHQRQIPHGWLHGVILVLVIMTPKAVRVHRLTQQVSMEVIIL